MNPGIMTRLRTETAEQHHHAEARPLEQALISGRVSKELYRDYLAQRYLIHRTLDTHAIALARRDARLAGIVTEELLQTPNLLADLEFLRASPDEIAPRRATEALLTDLNRTAAELPAALLGHYYVFEGSKNGARFIAKGLRHGLGLHDGRGMRYMDPHGERQRELWQQFKAAMDAVAFSEIECDAIVAAAGRAFDRIAELDDETYSAPELSQFVAA